MRVNANYDFLSVPQLEGIFVYAAFLAITITFGPIIKYPSNVQNSLNTSIKITGNGPLHYILNRAILLYPPQKQ